MRKTVWTGKKKFLTVVCAVVAVALIAGIVITCVSYADFKRKDDFCGNPSLSAVGIDAPMYFDSLSGAPTEGEMQRLKAYARSMEKPVNNYTPARNGLVYGKLGTAFEGLLFLYDATGDTELLDILIDWTDRIINGRNDMPAGDRRVIWDGTISPVYPNEEDPFKVPDSEQGEIAGKIFRVASLIYKRAELHAQAVPVGDGFNNGATYKERADTFITRAGETLFRYIIPTFIGSDFSIRYPFDDRFYDTRHYGNINLDNRMRIMMTNRQFMIAYATQYGAEVYAEIGETERATLCKKITQKSLESFEKSIKVQCVWSKKVADWYYWPTNKNAKERVNNFLEDTGHAAFDVLGYYRILRSGDYTARADMTGYVANTISYRLNSGDGTFAQNVRGKKGTETSLRPQFLLMAVYEPRIMRLVTTGYLRSATEDVGMFATLLYVRGMQP